MKGRLTWFTAFCGRVLVAQEKLYFLFPGAPLLQVLIHHVFKGNCSFCKEGRSHSPVQQKTQPWILSRGKKKQTPWKTLLASLEINVEQMWGWRQQSVEREYKAQRPPPLHQRQTLSLTLGTKGLKRGPEKQIKKCGRATPHPGEGEKETHTSKSQTWLSARGIQGDAEERGG